MARRIEAGAVGFIGMSSFPTRVTVQAVEGGLVRYATESDVLVAPIGIFRSLWKSGNATATALNWF